ncbi:MAG: nitroreductase family protein [archaeon]
MEFDKLVRVRKSVRSFSKKKASWKQVLEAIDAAVQGPFAGNNNNLRFLIVEDKKIIFELAGTCEQDWIAESEILVVVCSDDEHLETIYGERGRVYSRQQAGAAIQTIMLSLAEVGLGSCWVGAYDDDEVRDKLEIPGNIQIEAIIPIGYESVKERKKPKRKLESVLNWEKWGQGRRPTLFEEGKADQKG